VGDDSVVPRLAGSRLSERPIWALADNIATAKNGFTGSDGRDTVVNVSERITMWRSSAARAAAS
jgi:hypothetical protein